MSATVAPHPALFSITVSEAELDVVRLALGRMVEPKPVRSRAAAPKRRPVYPGKPPRLTDKQYSNVSHRWGIACGSPQHWRNDLIKRAALATNRQYAGGDVARAWGLDPETGL